jgi:NIPSNAP
MIYELRIYTCRPETMVRVLQMWEDEGRTMIQPYLHMVGQWTSETGLLNRIFTLWSFRDLNQREEARAQLLRHPGFAEYLSRCRELYIQQESILMTATAISPLQ